MTAQNKQRSVLWMLGRLAAGPNLKEVAFDPADAIYHLHKNTRNPFLQRAITPSARKLERSTEELRRLFRFFKTQNRYQIAPSNSAAPFQRRLLSHPQPPPAVKTRYLEPHRLQGNLKRLPWMIDVFFRAVLTRLKRDPAEFDDVVVELMEQFEQDGIRIKVYQAYQTLQDWDDLLSTLDEIAQYPSPETFDLFCSALFAYYDLVYPPDEV